MKQLFSISIVVSLFWALTACAIVPASVPGKTVASPLLQHDVLQMILKVDGFADRDCNQRKIVNTEIVGIFETRLGTKQTVEQWTLDRCGKIIPYQVSMMPSARGGTDFNVSSEAGFAWNSSRGSLQ